MARENRYSHIAGMEESGLPRGGPERQLVELLASGRARTRLVLSGTVTSLVLLTVSVVFIVIVPQMIRWSFDVEVFAVFMLIAAGFSGHIHIHIVMRWALRALGQTRTFRESSAAPC